MAVKSSLRCRQPGSLRLVTKTAKGRSYQRWQWRTHRMADNGWRSVDVELGEDLTCMRVRVLVALGELNPHLLIERWVRWRFRFWEDLPAWTGQPAAARGRQRAAWWIELPRNPADAARLRFRSLDGTTDYRRKSVREAVVSAESIVGGMWRSLSDDPIRELARLQWLEREAERVIAEIGQAQLQIRRQQRQGELSKRDAEADILATCCQLEGWESLAGASRQRWDDLLSEMVAAMPRTRRDADRSRIVALADRTLQEPAQRQRWQSDHWDGDTLRWSL